jgi:2-iminobutanoate/2-iminopropanoate deaminase
MSRSALSRRGAVVASALMAGAGWSANNFGKGGSHMQSINSTDGPAPSGGYSQAVAVRPRRTLYISGQIPVATDSTVPMDFAAQCRLVWANVQAQLRGAGLSFDHLVKVTTYLADREHAAENSAIRRQVIGSRAPALTVVIAGIYDPAWLLEIEAIAVEE